MESPTTSSSSIISTILTTILTTTVTDSSTSSATQNSNGFEILITLIAFVSLPVIFKKRK